MQCVGGKINVQRGPCRVWAEHHLHRPPAAIDGEFGLGRRTAQADYQPRGQNSIRRTGLLLLNTRKEQAHGAIQLLRISVKGHYTLPQNHRSPLCQPPLNHVLNGMAYLVCDL